MKKLFFLLVGMTMLTACAQYRDAHLSYKQKGKDCIYTEEFGYTQVQAFSKKEDFFLQGRNFIKYENTLCDKIIQSDLNNKTNKTTIANSGANKTYINTWGY